MQVFVRTIEKGGFTQASEDLGVTPSAISKAIGRLEKRLGVRLINRTTRSLNLTEEGRLFFERSKSILSLIEIAESEVAALNEKPAGRIKVSVGSAFAKHQLIPKLPAFQKAFPHIQLELNITDLQVDLWNHECDIAIRPYKQETSGLKSIKLSMAKRFICASPYYLEEHGSPQRPVDLDRHNCLTMAFDDTFLKWPFKNGNSVKNIAVSGNVRSDNADALLDLALAGHGIVRLLDTIVGPSIENGQLVSLLSETHLADQIPVWAVTRAGNELIPRISVFIQSLQNL